MVYQGSTAGQVITGLTLGNVYYFKIFTRSGSTWSTGVEVSGLANAVTLYSRGSGSANTGAIWSLTPTGTPATAASLGGFATDKNIQIQSGDLVEITASGINCLNLIVDNGGTLWRNNTSTGSMAYFNVYSDIICNGTIGNGNTFDAIGFNMEGANVSISGSGTFDAGRIRKNTATPNPVTILTFNKGVSAIRFFGGAALYNNADNTQFNIIIPSGKILSIPAADGDVALDGTDGTSLGERGGNLTVSGIINIGGRLFARTNNTTQNCSISIQASGRIYTSNLTSDITSGIGFPFTIVSGGKLLVSKILLVSNGTLNSNNGIVLTSTGNQTALIDGSGAGDVAGNVTVQRKVGGTTGFHYLSSPVSNAFVSTPNNGWSDDFPIVPAWDNFAYNPTVTNFATFPQVWEYNEADPNPNPGFGWVGATSATDPLTPLKGFACIVPANTVVDVFGPVNNGPVNYSVTNVSDGLNLIGNPYPSPISWNSFRSHNPALSATYQAFITSGGYAGNYGTYNGIVGTLGVGNVIASSQGFFVTAVNTGSIQALNSDRTTDLAPTFFREVNAGPKDLIRVELENNAQKDELVIYFDENGSDEIDSFDGIKIKTLQNGISSIYSKGGNKGLAINACGAFSKIKTIPLVIDAANNGNFKIQITDLSTFNPSAMIYLVDAETGIEQNVRLNPEKTVSLNAGTIENRFFLKFVPGISIETEQASCENNGSATLKYCNGKITYSLFNEDQETEVANGNLIKEQKINGLPKGNYSLKVFFADGFQATEKFILGGSAKPILENQVNNMAIKGVPVQLQATSNLSKINWIISDGTTLDGASVQFTFQESGNHFITCIGSSDECSVSKTFPIFVEEATGFDQPAALSFDAQIIGNQLVFNYPFMEREYISIHFYNLEGKLLYKEDVKPAKGKNYYQLPILPEQLILVNIFSSENQQVVKFNNKK